MFPYIGLTLGGLLHKAGIHFDIFEKAPVARTVGTSPVAMSCPFIPFPLLPQPKQKAKYSHRFLFLCL